MRVAVTGGRGFVGGRLVEVLRAHGYEVRVLSRAHAPGGPAGVQFIAGDLASAACPLAELVEDCSVVFHCAGEVRDASLMQAVHVGGTKRLLAAVRREAERRRREIRWVQLSSVGVYGPPRGPANDERVVTEDTPTHPMGEYETTKALADEAVISAGEPGVMSFAIVRPSIVIGRGMPNRSLQALGGMVRRRLFFYIGKPGAVATYVHVDDVVEVMRRCAADDRAKGRVFNLSNDCPLEELITGMAAAFNVRPPRLRLSEAMVRIVVRIAAKGIRLPLTEGRIDALVARTRYPTFKLQEELGFTPRESVPVAIGGIVRG